MSKRISITLPEDILEELEIWATQQGRTVASLAGYLVEKAVDEARLNNIRLPTEASADLQRWAAEKGLTPATLAQVVLIDAIQKAKKEGEISQ